MLDLLTFIAGLFSSYLAVNIVYRELSLPKMISSVIAVYFSFVMLLGLYMDFAGIALSPQNFLILFLLTAIAEYSFLKKKKMKWSKINADATYILGYLVIILAATVYYTSPSAPSFFPIGTVEDAPRHFVLTQYIQEIERIPHEAFYGFGNVMISYPFGMHLNIALLSGIFGIALIKFIFPFSAFIVGLSGATIMGIAAEHARCNKYVALLSGFLVISSPYVIYQLSLGGAWAILFGGFLATVFLWFLLDYFEDFTSGKLVLLILLQAALVLSYPYWAVITLVSYLLVQVFREDLHKDRLLHTGYFVLGSVSLSFLFWSEKLVHVGSRFAEKGAYIKDPLQAYGFVFVGLVLYGIYKGTFRKARVFLFFLFAIGMQPILLYFYSLLANASIDAYWYFRIYYFAVYPLAIFASIGVSELYQYLVGIPAVQKDRAMTYFLILLLVSSLGWSTYMQFIKAGPKHTFLGITPSEYSAAEWVRDNAGPDDEVVYIVQSEVSFVWLLAVSHHFGPHALSSSPLDEGKGNEIYLVQNIDMVPIEKTRDFEVLYYIKNSAVLRRK